MRDAGWAVVEVVAQSLDLEEREAVLGDLTEGCETAWQGLLDVVGLVIRRQVILWKSWRPWLAVFGVTVPCSFLLMGVSLTVSQACLLLIASRTPSETGQILFGASLMLICHILLLAGWSWTAGFVVGSVSRRTVWVSAFLCCSPCLFCLARFRVPSLSRFCLLLFLLPAMWGVRWGWQFIKLRLNTAIVLNLAITLMMIVVGSSSGQRWWSPPALVLSGFLSWPAWYLVLTARRFARPTC